MKVVKGLAFFLFFSIVLGSCFDPPEYPDEPSIGLDNIRYSDNPDGIDSLVFTLNFRDGDGDLGLDPQNPEHFVAPFNFANFFQTNSAGEFVPLETDVATVTNAAKVVTVYDFIDVDPAAHSILVYGSRFDPKYASLPAFENNCSRYAYREFIIPLEDSAALGPFTLIEDTLKNGSNLFLLAKDTLYNESNPNHYNIEVRFFREVGSNNFEEYDWRKERCATFDGRFPVLSSNGNTALDGKLKYRMESAGFNILFPGKMKLEIKIRDRKLHESNVVVTDVFTLKSIR